MFSHMAHGHQSTSIHDCTALMWSRIQKGYFSQGASFLQRPSLSLSHNPSSQNPSSHQHCTRQNTIMDNHTQEPDHSMNNQTQQMVQYSPTTPSTPPTLGAPSATNTPASQPRSRVWLSARPPGTALEDAYPYPMQDGDHAHVFQTQCGDLVIVHSDNPRSCTNQAVNYHPRDTEYSMFEDGGVFSEDGKSLVGVLEEPGPGLVPGSVFGLPKEISIQVDKETVVSPIFGHSQSHSHNPAPPPVSQSARLSNMARRLNEYMREGRNSRDDGE
jgi:hypothetical protein